MNLYSRYIWLVDTINRHGRITRQEINKLWVQSPYSDGNPMPRRTFYNYRQAVEEIFNIVIENDPSTYEYYIPESEQKRGTTAWLLDSAATSDIITGARDVADRIFLENVPSARQNLPTIVQALRDNVSIKFDYHPYTRTKPTTGVVVEPYFTKIFKQRWYVVGRNVKEDKIKTYALDRMQRVTLQRDTFKLPADFDPATYFRDAFGIVVDQGQPKTIKLKVEPTRAKYFKALPLHHTQDAMETDAFTIFTYKMRITRDLVADLLSYGSEVTVMQPPELKAMIVNELQKSLNNYK